MKVKSYKGREVVSTEYSENTNIGPDSFTKNTTNNVKIRRNKKINPEIKEKIIPTNYHSDEKKYPFDLYFHWNKFDLADKQIYYQGFQSEDFDILMNPMTQGKARKGNVHGFFVSNKISTSLSYGGRLVVVEVYKDKDNIPTYNGPSEFSKHSLEADRSGGRYTSLKSFKAITSMGGIRKFRRLRPSDIHVVFPKDEDVFQLSPGIYSALFSEVIDTTKLEDLIFEIHNRPELSLAFYSGVVDFNIKEYYNYATNLFSNILFGKNYKLHIKDIESLISTDGLIDHQLLTSIISGLPRKRVKNLLMEISRESHNKSDYALDFSYHRFMLITALEKELSDFNWSIKNANKYFFTIFNASGRSKKLEKLYKEQALMVVESYPEDIKFEIVKEIEQSPHFKMLQFKVKRLELNTNLFTNLKAVGCNGILNAALVKYKNN